MSSIATIFILGMFGAPEIILVVVVILILFGGRKIPELMKGIGKGIKEFKSATNQNDGTIDDNNSKNDKE